MKRFVLHATVFCLFCIASLYFIFSAANGKADPFYIRFTAPTQTSLILGTSRAAQGILPSVLNKQLLRTDFFSYAFSGNLSPYGPAYFESIKKKLNPLTKNGIFILSVDPWGISGNSQTPDDSMKFEERNLMLGKLNSVSSKPNFSYLWNWYSQHYWELLGSHSRTFLHNDGWLEVSVPMDSVSITKRRKNKLKEITGHDPGRFSKMRYDYLKKTIEFLKKHGTVYLVRLPMHPSIMEIEQKLMPDFDDKMEETAAKTKVSYYNMTPFNADYTFTDGNHLYKESGKEASEKIANWIKTHK